MIRRPCKPLALALGLTLAGSAAAAPLDLNSKLDPAQFDKTVSPCTNLFDFVNDNWLKAHPIPADRVSWGAFAMLDERSLNAQHEIAESLAKAKNAQGSIEQKIADFYATGMDEAAVEKAGYTPIKDDLKRIDGLSTPEEFAGFVRDYAAQGLPFLFGFGSNADFHDARRMIAYAGQGGIGLPERDYYFKTDDASKKIRDAYVLHVQRLLELVGTPKDEAAKQAKAVMDFETKLADASLPIVEMRNPANRYNFVSFVDADKTTPDFSWEKFFASQNIVG